MFEKFAEDVNRRYQEKLAEITALIEKTANTGFGRTLKKIRSGYLKNNISENEMENAIKRMQQHVSRQLDTTSEAMKTRAFMKSINEPFPEIEKLDLFSPESGATRKVESLGSRILDNLNTYLIGNEIIRRRGI